MVVVVEVVVVVVVVEVDVEVVSILEKYSSNISEDRTVLSISLWNYPGSVNESTGSKDLVLCIIEHSNFFEF